MEWLKNLTVMEHIFFWLGIVSTLLLIIQIILLCISGFGGDIDVDGDGDIDVDTDSGISIFTVKSMTAFFAVGSWTGLLTCTVASDKLQWLAIIFALLAGAAAMVGVAFAMRAIYKLQCNGAFEIEKIIGQQATVYVSVPPARSGRGKITLNAQGRYVELDAVTDCDSRLAVDETVEIVSTENECTVVRRIALEVHTDENKASANENE